MADYRLPHEVFYETKEPVTVEDVIESLLGTQDILTEMGPLLEACIPGITVERVEISIKEISEGSLKEVLWVALFVAYQTDLEKEVPNLVEELFGTTAAHQYPTVTTVFFLLVLFYGADFVYKRLSKMVEGSGIRAQLDGLISEVAGHCKIPEEKLRQILDDRYGKGRMRSLAKSMIRVFQPSKRHGNAALRIGGRRIEPRIVAEIPGDAQMLEFDDPPQTQTLQNVEIELHAQDMDRTKQGWAAIIPVVSKQRIRMELYPPIRPIDIYTRQKIRGDVIVVFKEGTKGEQEPSIYHLVRLKGQPDESHPSPEP